MIGAVGSIGRLMSTTALTRFVGALDSLQAALASSMRKLYSNYTGACVRVRRSSDGAETDIGFKLYAFRAYAYWIDEEALLAFAGSSSLTIVFWYDQSGNNYHAGQATVANQPRIVNNGVIDRQNGFPSLFFDGAGDHLIAQPNTLLEVNPQVVLSVVNLLSNTTGFNSIVSNDQPGQYGHGFGNGAGGNAQIMFNNGWATATAPWPINSLRVATASWSTSNVELYLNGTSIISRGSREDITALNAGDYVCIGAGQPNSLTAPPKYISEVITINSNWASRPSAQSSLERNIGAAFAIAVA